jgi:hypothetical protein
MTSSGIDSASDKLLFLYIVCWIWDEPLLMFAAMRLHGNGFEPPGVTFQHQAKKLQ